MGVDRWTNSSRKVFGRVERLLGSCDATSRDACRDVEQFECVRRPPAVIFQVWRDDVEQSCVLADAPQVMSNGALLLFREQRAVAVFQPGAWTHVFERVPPDYQGVCCES